jgi:NADH-quinone oxidoreductase subunit A
MQTPCTVGYNAAANLLDATPGRNGMPQATAQFFDSVSIAVYLAGVLLVLLVMLGVPVWLGGRNWARAKGEPFESGVISEGGSRLRLSAKFYLVAMFFVLFDVEALFLYAWAVAVRETGWPGFWGAVAFIIELLVGLWYLVRIGALEWAHDRREPRPGGRAPMGGDAR